MTATKTIILTKDQIDQRIIRMAYEIYEHNIERKKIILAGVSDNGFKIASMINDQLSKISKISTNIVKIDINKEQPLKEEIQIPLTQKELEKQSIVIVDDVLNSGRTVAFVLKAFLHVNVKKIEVATIVNRSHKSFPIYPEYVGYELATTINDHVEVIVEGNKKGAYLY